MREGGREGGREVGREGGREAIPTLRLRVSSSATGAKLMLISSIKSMSITSIPSATGKWCN